MRGITSDGELFDERSANITARSFQTGAGEEARPDNFLPFAFKTYTERMGIGIGRKVSRLKLTGIRSDYCESLPAIGTD